MKHGRRTIRWSLLVVAAAVSACGGSTALESPPPAPSPPELMILPSKPTLVLGGSIPFQALLQGAPVEVTWQLDESDAGSITPSGLFTSGICFGAGYAHVRARLQSDLSRSATTQV